MAAARLLSVALLGVLASLVALSAVAQSPTLTVSGRNSNRTFTEKALLASAATRSVTVADPVYRRTMTYRAIPLAELLKGTGIGPDDHLQARATDNFSAAIPGRLAALAVTDSPLKRWPGLAVGADVPAGDPIRTGLDRFVSVCMACHRFNGAGEGEQGPDLGRPMNVTQYFQIPALKKLIRDPASVRRWPEQKMPGFDQAALSDSDLDAIVDWLAYKARQQRR